MPEATTLDIVTVGHFVIDRINLTRRSRPRMSLGGPPAFVSLAARKLGSRVGAVSKVGKDFHKYLEWLHEQGVDMSRVHVAENALTTSYVLTYTDRGRVLQLKNKAPQIELCDIPDFLPAKIIHVAPVAGELSAKIIPQLTKRRQVLSLDPQGLLRRVDERGMVRLEAPPDLGFLKHCGILKASLHEARVLTGHSGLKACLAKIREHGVRIILITMGEEGACACFGNEVYHIPACKPRAFRDPTGAGDTFAGGFLAEYVRGREPLWCCCVGSAAASFVVEEVGSKRFGERSEVCERAIEIYEEVISQSHGTP